MMIILSCTSETDVKMLPNLFKHFSFHFNKTTKYFQSQNSRSESQSLSFESANIIRFAMRGFLIKGLKVVLKRKKNKNSVYMNTYFLVRHNDNIAT